MGRSRKRNHQVTEVTEGEVEVTETEHAESNWVKVCVPVFPRHVPLPHPEFGRRVQATKNRMQLAKAVRRAKKLNAQQEAEAQRLAQLPHVIPGVAC